MSHSKTYITFFAIISLHLALLLHFAPLSTMFSKEPIQTIDYSLHYYQVDRALKSWQDAKQLWGYDPHQLAGQPAGLFEDLSSKSLELFVIALSSFGIAPALAFNLYILVVHLLLPFCGYFSARLFHLTKNQALLVTFFWVVLWFFDSFFHWCWYCGMISWAASSYLVILFTALFYRAIEELSIKNSILFGIGSAFFAALIALVHPFACIAALLPCAVIYFRSVRSMHPLGHIITLVCLVAAISTSLIWLVPALSFSHYLQDSESFLRPSLDYLLYDFLDLLKDGLETGIPVRTVFRTVFIAAGGIALWHFWKNKDRRALPLTILVAAGFIISYFGGLFWIAKQTQPYRNISVAAMAAAIPAVILFWELLSPRQIRQFSGPVKVLLVLALLLIVPRVARSILYYFPEIAQSVKNTDPAPYERNRTPLTMNDLSGPLPVPMKHYGIPPQFKEIRSWLIDNYNGRGRILVQQYPLGEYLAWSTNFPIIGGLPMRNVPHVDALLFRIDPKVQQPAHKLKAYLERYAIGYVIMSNLHWGLERRKELVKFRERFDDLNYRIYETTITPNYFLKGSGKIESQEFNRIKINNAQGAEVILRFHWMETLKCRPNCLLERFAVQKDRVGFIRIPNPPPKFEIYNSYEF